MLSFEVILLNVKMTELCDFVGAGKSLLLLGEGEKSALLSGILGCFYGGDILWHAACHPSPLAVVFGDKFFPPALKGAEIGRIFSGIYQDWDSNAFRHYLSQLNLPHNRPLYHKHQRFRLALATALARNPQLLFYDPPQEEPPDQDWEHALGDCRRVLARTALGKIITAPDYDRGQSYVVDAYGFFKEGAVVFWGQAQDCAVVQCTVEDCWQISPHHYLCRRVIGGEVTLLVDDPFTFFQHYPQFPLLPVEISQMEQLILVGE